MENSFGVWEGLSEVDIEKKYPGQLQERLQNHWRYAAECGESYADLYARITDFLTSLTMGTKYIVVTHEVVSKCLQGALTGLPHEQITTLRHPNNEYIYYADQETTRICFSD